MQSGAMPTQPLRFGSAPTGRSSVFPAISCSTSGAQPQRSPTQRRSHGSRSSGSIVRCRSDPRFRLLIEGYLPDHWLVPQGRIRAWKRPGAPAGGRHLGLVHALAAEEAGRSPRGSRCETEGSRSSRERASALCAGAAPTRSSFRTPRRTWFSTASLRPLTVKLSDISVSDERPTAAWPRHATACVPAGTAT